MENKQFVAAYRCPACLQLVPEVVWRYGLQLCAWCADEQDAMREEIEEEKEQLPCR